MADRAEYTARLRANLDRAEAEYARIEGRVLVAREAGVDTSRPVGVSAQSSDQTLRKAEAAVAFARRVLADYVKEA